ncbi:GntP family permease [Endozoicomonadaceae bacterium StTr2]
MDHSCLHSLLIITALVFAIVILIGWRRYSPFIVLLVSSWVVAVGSNIPLADITPMVSRGMGQVFGQTALIIFLGTLLGNVLEKSGGALLLADRIIALLGKRYPALALAMTGYLVSIPVYCDSGFILLNSIRESIALKTGSNPVTLSTGLAGGLYATHTMVPPTPGPAAAAIILGLSPSVIIPYGALLALAATLAGLYWGHLAVRWTSVSEVKRAENTEHITAPDLVSGSIWIALLPILLPLVLMSVASFHFQASNNSWATIFAQPANALVVGLLVAIPLFKRCRQSLSELVSESIRACGGIILVIAAGGALAETLRQSGHISVISRALPDEIGLLLPFLIAAVFKIAQGSSTVALIASASMIEPMLPALGLGSETGKILALFSAGAGAMFVAHANDSYFWVVAQFSRFDAATAYRSFTMATLVQGITCYLLVQLAALIVL